MALGRVPQEVLFPGYPDGQVRVLTEDSRKPYTSGVEPAEPAAFLTS